MKKAIKLHKKDNVATALDIIEADETIEIVFEGKIITTVKAKQSINKYFKLSLDELTKNSDVIKYGEVIGKTNYSLTQGDLVHVEAIRSVKV